jgi:predicted porin
MKKTLMTFALLGAVAAAHAQEQQPGKPGDASSAPAAPAPELKKPSMVCTGGVCSEPVPAPAAPKEKEAAAEYPNLRFGIYGIADLALLYRDNVLNDPAHREAGTTNYLSFISGGRNQSRIGLRGSYELGEQYRAFIQLEKGFNYNDGTCEDGSGCDPLQFFNRRAYLGLEKEGIGRISFGRQLTSMYDILIQTDPMGYSPAFSWLPTAGSADPSSGKFNSGRYGTRVDRMIKYEGRFPLAYVNAYYALGDTTSAIVNQSRFGGGVILRLSPLSLVAVYDHRNLTLTNVGLSREQAFSFAIKATLLNGVVTPVAGVRRYVKTLSVTNENLFFGGITFKATERLSFTVADYFDKKQDGTGQDDNLLAVRANYMLGKIVETYVTYGHATGANGGFAGVMRANDTLPAADSQNGLAVGLRIRFGYPPTSAD